MKRIGTYLLITGLLAFGSFKALAAGTSAKSDSTVNCHVSGFTEVKIGGPFEAYISQGTDESVKYIAPAELLKYITVDVDHGVLKIRRKVDGSWLSSSNWKRFNQQWEHRDRIKIYIVVNDLKSLTMSGSGEAMLEMPLSSNSLTLRTRGSGSIEGKVNAKFFEGRVSGSGNMAITGTAETSAVRVSGSGHFNGGGLTTGVSSVSVSGSGHAAVNASDKIDATVHGSGSISYSGQPRSVIRKTSGSGAIQGS